MNNAAPLPIVSSIEPAGRGDVFDITVEGEHEFFAEGILVKNCDEVGLWRVTKTRKGEEKGGVLAWQQSIEFAVREAPARIIATGTPKGKKGVVKLLLEEPDGRVVFTFPRLADNRANIDRATYEGWLARWGGTRLGKQELEGMVLEDVEGALWRLAEIEALRISEEVSIALEHRKRTVVAIDPAATVTGDETGIIAATLINPNEALAADLGIEAGQQHGIVLADRSGNYTPEGWASAAIDLYRKLGADRIVAERNNGGDMVESVLRAVDPNVPVKLVWASKGKQPRAEPVAALYEKARIHHHGVFEDLEAEQTTWVPGEDSPNRMDALVWAFTELMLDGQQDYAFAGTEQAGEIEAPITADIMARRW